MQTTPFPPSEYESWGLDRIDQRNLPYDDAFTTPYNGTGVEIYILDSGINTEHDELVGGRAACGFDAINDPPIPCGDVDGHGTAMAAIAGGHYIGVAPGAELISVKIGNDDAVMSALLAGIEYVTQQKLQNPTQPMVASLSIGGFTEEILDIAIERMHDVGVFVAVAAGNEFRDACYASPARIAKVVTVGATGEFDQLWNGTNYGPCVDLFAPGDLVWHPSKKGNDRYKLSSGTSNAVPFVAGVAALYLEKVPRMLPTRIGNFLRTTATRQILTTPYKTTKRNWFVATSTPNRLLNLGSLLA